MRIITYNINGIRAVMKKNFLLWLKAANPDILCLQEVKATSDQFSQSEFKELGYYFYLYPAVRKGYSGVAILSKIEPNHVEFGCGISKYDDEGRVIRADFDTFSVMSVYMPSGASKPERQQFKLEWLTDFYQYVQSLNRHLPKLVIGGDFNICHQPIDIHNPYSMDGYPGFTAEERDWMTDFLNLGYFDSFRHLNPEPHQYSWWSYMSGARSKNLGWRIDYILLPMSWKEGLLKAMHLTDAFHSDHCPVLIQLEH